MDSMPRADVHFPWLTPHSSAGAVNRKTLLTHRTNKNLAEESCEPAINLQTPYNAQNFLASLANIGLSNTLSAALFKHVI
jgi:hypothetical protein